MREYPTDKSRVLQGPFAPRRVPWWNSPWFALFVLCILGGLGAAVLAAVR